MVIPDELLDRRSGPKLFVKDVDQTLCAALFANGYADRSYFAVPNGYAMVTRLEQFGDDGQSKPLPDRWALDSPPLRTLFSLSDYIDALFTANPGRYRLIVFIVTPTRFSQSDASVNREEAMNWLGKGWNELPASFDSTEYSTNYACTALVYEFEQKAKGHRCEIKLPGLFSGGEHLEKSNIWKSLNNL